MSEKRLYDMLKEYAQGDMQPFHMPGHKRQSLDYLENLSSQMDITEIPGFDNLHYAEDILKSSMVFAAELFGAYRSFYSVNGSTAGILAAVYALVQRGDKVIVARNCHMSVYHALEICGAIPVYVYPEFDVAYGIYTGITCESVKKVLDENFDAEVLILTSPTYEGVISDISGICRAAHEKGVKVIIDSAHGAHLGFDVNAPESPVRCGADIVVQSLHKTLPSFTGTAIVHAASPEIADKLERALDIFQTTSPSYLMLASIDGCMHWLKDYGEQAICEWYAHVAQFRKSLNQFKYLKLFNIGEGDSEFRLDIGKIFIGASSLGMSGYALYAKLRNVYHIEPEMYTAGGVLLMTSPLDSQEKFDMLFSVFHALDRACNGSFEIKNFPEPCHAEVLFLPSDCRKKQGKCVDRADAVGKISLEYVCAYPPGTPILIPGEKVTAEFLAYESSARRCGVDIKHFGLKKPDTFFVSDK